MNVELIVFISLVSSLLLTVKLLIYKNELLFVIVVYFELRTFIYDLSAYNEYIFVRFYTSSSGIVKLLI